MGITHLAFGLMLYAGFTRVIQLPLSTETLVAVGVGSWLPDIDHPHSLISKHALLLVVSKAVRLVVRHRGPTHSLLVTVVLTGLVLAVTLYYQADLLIPVAFGIGYLSHLAADSLTRSGVKWLWPFRRGKVSWIIYTGGRVEQVFFWGSLLGFALIVQ